MRDYRPVVGGANFFRFDAVANAKLAHMFQGPAARRGSVRRKGHIETVKEKRLSRIFQLRHQCGEERSKQPEDLMFTGTHVNVTDSGGNSLARHLFWSRSTILGRCWRDGKIRIWDKARSSFKNQSELYAADSRPARGARLSRVGI